MKYFIMEGFFVFCLFCVQMFHVSTTEFNPILQQISLQKQCNEEGLFRHFSLSSVTQFGALCNIEVPKTEEADFLLENNVVPILCMGLYEVSLRSCRAALNNTIPFAEIFPPSVDKFTTLFNTLKGNTNFTSLTIFCKDTVKNYKIKYSANNDTNDWWSLLNKELSDTKKCSSICRTNEDGRVHPLCSYIVWSNAIFIEHLKSQASVDFGPNNIPATDSNSKIGKVEKVKEENDNPVENPSGRPPAVDGPDKHSYVGIPLSNVGNDTVNTSKEPNLSNVIKNTHYHENGNITNKNQPKDTSEVEVNTIDKLIEKERLENAIQQINATGELTKNTTKIEEINTAPDGSSDSIQFAPTPEEQGQIPIEKDDEVDGDGDDADIPPELSKAGKKNELDQGVLFQSNAMANKDVDSEKRYSSEDIIMEDHFIETEDPHFVPYFLCVTVLVVLFYLAFYNKKKLVALAVEGRRTRNSRRRPNCSNYSKLNCNLEEALVSNTTASVTHVLY